MPTLAELRGSGLLIQPLPLCDFRSVSLPLLAGVVPIFAPARSKRWSLTFAVDPSSGGVTFGPGVEGQMFFRVVELNGGQTLTLTKFDIPGLIEQQWVGFTVAIVTAATITEVYEIPQGITPCV